MLTSKESHFQKKQNRAPKKFSITNETHHYWKQHLSSPVNIRMGFVFLIYYDTKYPILSCCRQRKRGL
jgi:hypothetical protein